MTRLSIYSIGISCLLYATCFASDDLTIGSKRFTESYLIGAMLECLAEEAQDARVVYKPGLGNTGIVFSALQHDLIQIYPEYTGTIQYEILKKPGPQLTIEELKPLLNSMELDISESLGFNNQYALAMKKERAEEFSIRTISDLSHCPFFKMGFSHEFLERQDGWAGLKNSAYHFPQQTVFGLDHSLSYEALKQGKIDVMDVYATDPKIERDQLVLLVDDRHFFPNDQAVLFYRLNAPTRFPKAWAAFLLLINRLSDSTMRKLNKEAEINGQDFSTIAKNFLQELPLAQASPSFLSRLIGPDLWRLTKQHLFLVFGSVIPAIFVGIPLGIVASKLPIARYLILSSVGLIQTIPSLALLAFLIPLFREIGLVPAMTALFLYALLPIVRNTYAGLNQIPSSLRESALALGVSPFFRLRSIELPLASGTILEGIKTAAVINVGTATIAAFIGAGGYGERIMAGLALNDYAVLLAGAIPACALALIVQSGFDLMGHYLIPKALNQ